MSNEVKFKKGDKILGQNYEMLGMYEGEVYTVRSCTETSMTLEECFCKETGRNYTFTPSMYELIEKRNYREMTPNDLITISVDGIESDVPLGDLIHARALIANAKGTFGYNLYRFLGKLDEDGVVDYVYEDIEVFDKQEELMKDFFIIEADKANLKELISNKQNELKELQDKLNQLN